MGPTASGKTALAFDMADRFPVEIISVDSAQVFIDMNLGTAKPDAETLARYPHHLIDLITPEESYSAARFNRDALALMADITARGKVPLLVGGTMLYFKALMDGLADMPQADPALRAEIDAQAAQQGWPAVHAELAKLDPETAARLAPNDSQRIQRALEVVRLTGQTMGALYATQKRNPLPYQPLALGLSPSDRGWLHQRIAERFDLMLQAGLIEEVEELQRKYRLSPDLPSMRSVGYRQVWEYLEGKMLAREMHEKRRELRDRGVFATRQFAKRQLTWFNTLSSVALFDCIAPQTPNLILDQTERFLAETASSLS